MFVPSPVVNRGFLKYQVGANREPQPDIMDCLSNDSPRIMFQYCYLVLQVKNGEWNNGFKSQLAQHIELGRLYMQHLQLVVKKISFWM